MRIYIAGQMRGVPNFNYPRFNAVAQILRDRGHEVVNPVEVGQSEHLFERGVAFAVVSDELQVFFL